MTREEFAYKLEIQPRFFSSGEFDCNDTNALDLAEKLFCIIDSLEEQNQGLQSLLDLKQQEISVLESKVLELEDSMDNSDEAIKRRYAKWAYPNEPKQN